MTDETDESPLSARKQERLDRIGAIQPHGVLLGGDLGANQICGASATAAGWPAEWAPPGADEPPTEGGRPQAAPAAPAQRVAGGDLLPTGRNRGLARTWTQG